MYKDTSYSIKVKQGCIEPIKSNLGLRQGCPLSPMLFNLFIEDVADIFGEDTYPIKMQGHSINYFLYADDLVLLSENANGLQNCLHSLGTYAEKKSLTISIKKSKTMIFNAAGLFVKKQFYIKENALEPVNTFCYLGFDMKPSGSVKHGMATLCDKANKALRPLLRTIANFQLSFKLSIKLFHTLISPIALYNVENWATFSDKQLENFTPENVFEYVEKSTQDQLHRKLLKYILGVNKTSPTLTIYGDTGETPLSIRGFTLMLNFWHRCRELPDTNLAKIALRENIDLRTNWIRTVERLLASFNLIEHTEKPLFKDSSKDKGNLFFKSKWKEKITNTESSRLKFYKRLNHDRDRAVYTDLPFFQRKVIAKLRCSSHSLEIEKGRHKKIDPQNRLCTLCANKAVEDEEHFLGNCETYEPLRRVHHFFEIGGVDIMNTTNQTNLAHYLTKALKLRKYKLGALH